MYIIKYSLNFFLSNMNKYLLLYKYMNYLKDKKIKNIFQIYIYYLMVYSILQI